MWRACQSVNPAVAARLLLLLGVLCVNAQVLRLEPRVDTLGRNNAGLSGDMVPLLLTGANFYDAAFLGPDARSFPHAVRTSLWPLADSDGWLGRASDGPFCRFGTDDGARDPVPATWLSPTEVQCNVVPSSDSPRTVAVELSLEGAEGAYTESGLLFTYYDANTPPGIDFLEPLSVPLGGGTRLRVHGTNFRDVPDGLCTFAIDGVVTSTPAQFVTQGEVACTTPAATAEAYASVSYDAGSGGTNAVSEGVSLFYSETSSAASTLVTELDRDCAAQRDAGEAACLAVNGGGYCEYAPADGAQPATCTTPHVSVVAGFAATFTISARSAGGSPLVPDGDVFYVDAVPQGLLYDHNRASGSFQALVIDEGVQCGRLGGMWSYESYVCSGAEADSEPVEQAACLGAGGLWTGVGEGTCMDGETPVDASLTEEVCTAYGDTWIPPVCHSPAGVVAAADLTECLETGHEWTTEVTYDCSSTDVAIYDEPWNWDNPPFSMPSTEAACVSNGRRWIELPAPELCVAEDGTVISGPSTQQECEEQPCKALGLFKACGYTADATCVPDDVPCGSSARNWDPERTHACYEISTGARVAARDQTDCQGGYIFRPPILAECRNSDGDLMVATDVDSCTKTNHTWSPGRCEGIEASITVDIRGSYSLEVNAGDEAIAGSPKTMTVIGVSSDDSCTMQTHDCSFNSTTLPAGFSFDILSVSRQEVVGADAYAVEAAIGPIVALGLEFTAGVATFEGLLDHEVAGATAAMLTGTLSISAEYLDALGQATASDIVCTAVEARCEVRDCEVINSASGILADASLVNGPVVTENVEICPLALECDALEPRGAYGMCNGACVPHGAAICGTGHVLSHQESCGLACTVSDTASYTLSGTQPYCFSGEVLTPPDNIRCTPDPCVIQGIVVPANAQIAADCVDGNILRDGSQHCFAKCNEGYYLSDHSVQPRCLAGHFFPGSVECLPYPCQISGIYAPANGRKMSTLSITEQNTEGSPCMGDDGVLTAAEEASGIGPYRPICNCNDDFTLQHGQSCALSCNEGFSLVGEQPSCSVGQLNKGSIECIPNDCPVTGLSAPQNGQLDAACANGGVLAHESSCLLTCDSDYTLAGRQPSCFAGTLDVGTVTCLPNMCVVPAVSVPSNSVLGGACREGNILPDGSSCNVECKSGYILTGDQPSCTAGVFDPGSVSCTADFSIMWLDREGLLFSASLEGTDPEMVIDTIATTRNAVFCSFLPGFKQCGDGACVPQYQPCRGSCSDTIGGVTACEDDTCIAPSEQCSSGEGQGWCEDCVSRGIGLAVDNARDHVYWTDPGASLIRWASLEFDSNGDSLQSGAIRTGRGDDVRDIAVVDGQVFWTCADLENCGATAAAGGVAMEEACYAVDSAVCEAATAFGADACDDAARCEYTPYADAACVAAAASACDAVSLPSDQSTCQAAGACIYTAASEGVEEACRASAAATCAGVQHFNQTTCEAHRPSWWLPASSPCTYIPVREPICTALDMESCESVTLGGFIDTTRAACYAAGDCLYTPSRASAGVVMATEGSLVDLAFSDTAFSVTVNDAADEVFWSGLPSQHTCADLSGVNECSDGSCAVAPEHCTGNMPDTDPRSVLRASVAADQVCDAVDLSNTATENTVACETSGNCDYVAAAEEVIESCEASDMVACAAAAGGTEQTCLDAADSGSCSYGASIGATCIAAAASSCDAVSLPSDQSTCENAGDCTYTAENTAASVEESCAATHHATCRALDADQSGCDGNSDCLYRPEQAATCAASDASTCSGVDFGSEAHTAVWGRNLCENAGACSYTAHEAEVLEDCIAAVPGTVVKEGRAAVLHAPATRASSLVYSSAHETVYWSDWDSDSIVSRPRASADSAAPDEVVAAAGAGGAADLAIDQESGWLYWTSEADQSIKRICVGTSTGAGCPHSSGVASIGDSTTVVSGVEAVALAVSRPLLPCPFTELGRLSPPCVTVLSHKNVAADCAADTDGCRSIVCDYCTEAGNFDAAGCPGWRVELGCTDTTLVTADGEGCIFPVDAEGMNATMTSCEDMMDYAAALVVSGEFSGSVHQERARYPWCYTAPATVSGSGWLDAAEAAGEWGWCYDRTTDPCAAATGCTSCGALSWAGRPDQRCHWCESAHTCAPTAEYCAVVESEFETVERKHQYVHMYEATQDEEPTSAIALVGSERIWRPVPAAVLPSTDRLRDQCSDFYFYARDYTSDAVHDPNRQYFAPPTSEDAAAERWKRDGWFDFSVPAVTPWEVAPWCVASESGYGLVRQIDRLQPCTEGTTLPNSPSVCVGTVGEQCAFLCMAGFVAVGDHICHADGVFRGGVCVE